MTVIGTVLQELVKLRKTYTKLKPDDAYIQQYKTLRKLIKTAAKTEFGKAYDFEVMLKSRNLMAEFQQKTPVFDYDKMYDKWWKRALNDEPDISWPGKIKHFALSSGTSGSPSKRIPVSSQMIRSVRKVSIEQMMSLTQMDVKSDFYETSLLIVGGSIDLVKVGDHLEGDLSGVLASKLPIWFQKSRKPSKQIMEIRDWEEKLQKITEEAKNWDIGIISGVPAWVQILVHKIIDYYQVDSIHDIWPNLKFYVHGGVNFSPYREGFKKLLGSDVHFLETYLASEGFLAIETEVGRETMKLMLDKGIFFEFVPFNESNFTADGQITDTAETLLLHQVKKNTDYAVLITTCSGTWRYMIGDTVRFNRFK